MATAFLYWWMAGFTETRCSFGCRIQMLLLAFGVGGELLMRHAAIAVVAQTLFRRFCVVFFSSVDDEMWHAFRFVILVLPSTNWFVVRLFAHFRLIGFASQVLKEGRLRKAFLDFRLKLLFMVYYSFPVFFPLFSVFS